MCGIFGVISSSKSRYENKFLKKILKNLATLSESRGKDSSGLCCVNHYNNSIDIVKGPISATELFKRSKVKEMISNVFNKKNLLNYKLAFGHARLVTNGSQLNDDNNQPIVKDGIVCVHNGIIVNADDLWLKHNDLVREFEIDTEILPSLLRKNFRDGIDMSLKKAFKDFEGTISTAIISNDSDKLLLATNNGSLYILLSSDLIIFASERSMLNKLAEKLSFKKKIRNYSINQLFPNTLFSLSLEKFTYEINEFTKISTSKNIYNRKSKEFCFFKEKSFEKQLHTVVDLNMLHLSKDATLNKKLLCYPKDKIKNLKRCTKCILPETFPHIIFNDVGVCNYCLNYKKKNQYRSLDELKELVAPYKSNDGSPDCLVPFSGGRDSVYTLHVIKNILGLNPITFTYDWGMVTDLARRNIARICGKLGVENIIVAADIHWKRKNIKLNIESWLQNPELGMIPLFMAGDKFFFYYAEKVKKDYNIKLNIWGINHLENTDFKTGFGGLEPNFNKDTIYSLSFLNQFKLFYYVGKNIIKTPSYLNQSIFDSLGSFASRYINPKRDYYHLFDYMKWDEKDVESTILNLYDWEKSVDTNSTWRIGDGTASFYNYIYTLVAGFSENDTFRSNQIREGIMSRDKALKLVFEENEPRYNSLKWYLEMLGLNFKEVINNINNIKRRY